MRKAKITDAAKIILLLIESFYHAWKKTKRKFHKTYFKNKILKAIKKDITIVEELDGKIVGFGWAAKTKDFFGNPHGEIKLILISPKHQKKNLGTKLLQALEKKLQTKDLRLDCLSTNPAQKLYKKQGYKDFVITLRKNLKAVK